MWFQANDSLEVVPHGHIEPTDAVSTWCEKNLFIGRVPVEATPDDLYAYLVSLDGLWICICQKI